VSSLTLVRHGQALFQSDDYDRLSVLGRRQARLLAEYWLAQGTAFDALYSGPLRRQRETAEEIAAAFERADIALPDVEVVDEWREFDGVPLTSEWPQELAREHSEVAVAMRTDRADPEFPKRFQAAFEVVMRRCIGGELGVPGTESWQQFQQRVVDSLEAVIERHPRGQRVAVVSSGGPIAVAVGHVLGVNAATTLELNWVIRNASVSEVLYSGDRINLGSFNATPHLPPELVTSR